MVDENPAAAVYASDIAEASVLK
ncbi:protein of unknown function [Aminobacter niigataensis]|nr:protein of unknown function [Aminobacter niigataensis]